MGLGSVKTKMDDRKAPCPGGFLSSTPGKNQERENSLERKMDIPVRSLNWGTNSHMHAWHRSHRNGERRPGQHDPPLSRTGLLRLGERRALSQTTWPRAQFSLPLSSSSALAWQTQFSLSKPFFIDFWEFCVSRQTSPCTEGSTTGPRPRRKETGIGWRRGVWLPCFSKSLPKGQWLQAPESEELQGRRTPPNLNLPKMGKRPTAIQVNREKSES